MVTNPSGYREVNLLTNQVFSIECFRNTVRFHPFIQEVFTETVVCINDKPV